jgi:hypothetical protein
MLFLLHVSVIYDHFQQYNQIQHHDSRSIETAPQTETRKRHHKQNFNTQKLASTEQQLRTRPASLAQNVKKHKNKTARRRRQEQLILTEHQHYTKKQKNSKYPISPRTHTCDLSTNNAHSYNIHVPIKDKSSKTHFIYTYATFPLLHSTHKTTYAYHRTIFRKIAIILNKFH